MGCGVCEDALRPPYLRTELPSKLQAICFFGNHDVCFGERNLVHELPRK
uniref:Uncharacterized protein n=1 Tax=Arundo donax TaxID=35708 RepID=A0A0A9EWV8_ARUDO